MIPRIIGLGCATPAGAVTQEEALAAAQRISALSENHRTIAALYRRTGIARRGTVLTDARGDQDFFTPAATPGDRGPSTAARLLRYRAEAPPLAAEACTRALADAATDPRSITHLITASCTGFDAPGIDAALIERLGLLRTVQRTHIGFMGCHAAVNALRVAAAFCRASAADVSRRAPSGRCEARGAQVQAPPAGPPISAARALVCCVELCTLHYSYAADPDKLVANAIFADGAAAAVVSSSPERGPAIPGPAILDTASCTFPGSADAMTWSIGDHGFEMSLSAKVPDMLRRHLRPWLSEWLARHDLAPESIASWAIHPGGPRVISTIAECLSLSEDQTAPSRAILAEHGNMSSPTILFILDRLRRQGFPGPCIAMAFGPGLAAEGLLLG